METHKRIKGSAITATAAAMLLLALQPAAAELVTLVEAVEVSPSNIILPGSVNGMVSFRPCGGDCEAEYRRARLTPDTRFMVDGRAVKFSDFQVDFANVRTRKMSYALVSVDVKTRTITSIQIEG